MSNVTFRPLPLPGVHETLFGTWDEWTDLRSGIEAMIATRPVGGYRLVLADPPWRFDNWSKKGEKKNASRHYPTVPIEILASLPVFRLAALDAALLLWCTGALLERQMQLLKPWGFGYAGILPWFKSTALSEGDEPGDLDWNPQLGLGYLYRSCAEFLVLGIRGNPVLLDARRSERGAFFDPVREHSRKPDDQYRKAECLTPGPYLELFSRTDRPGWTHFGNEAGRFGQIED